MNFESYFSLECFRNLRYDYAMCVVSIFFRPFSAMGWDVKFYVLYVQLQIRGPSAPSGRRFLVCLSYQFY